MKSLVALAFALACVPVYAADKPPTLKDAMGSAVEISQEVRQIEKRLESIDKSVAAMTVSLASVGALTQPERTTALLREAGDLAFDRALSLIFIATGCAAGLILLAAAVWRWGLRR
ncbi:hypothetical protein BWI17_21000 [Betaproteobacteria bacterium GR16-43]|nr:hypothetical protein BWI17_21000 [Betaproteobacteria bacterium GR16-43]